MFCCRLSISVPATIQPNLLASRDAHDAHDAWRDTHNTQGNTHYDQRDAKCDAHNAQRDAHNVQRDECVTLLIYFESFGNKERCVSEIHSKFIQMQNFPFNHKIGYWLLLLLLFFTSLLGE